MKFLQNLLLTLVLVGGMFGVYLYAGQQERISSAEIPAESAATPSNAVVEAPEVSFDGRLKTAVLQTFADAGYVFAAQSNEEYQLSNAAGEQLADVYLSLQGERVNGLVLCVPVPRHPDLQKNPTAIEQMLSDAYDAAISEAKTLLPKLLDASLQAIDPYGEVPLTARMYWKELALKALDSEKETSDASEAIRLRIYFSDADGETQLCLSLQKK